MINRRTILLGTAALTLTAACASTSGSAPEHRTYSAAAFFETTAYGMSAHRKLRTTALQRQTVLAYALTMFKAKTGRYPPKLDAKELGVSPNDLIDPYTEKPFVDEIKNGKRRLVCREPTKAGVRFSVGGKPLDQHVEHVLELP